MSLVVQCTTLLCFFFAISSANTNKDVSIAQMAEDLLSSSPQHQVAVTNDVKEWTLDWMADQGDVRDAMMTPSPSVDAKKLLEDILCDDGHDEESDMGDEWTSMDPTGRCGCCGAMKSITGMYPSQMMMPMYTPMGYQNYQPFANKRQPQTQSFNGLVQTVCDRLVADIKMSGLDPMPLMLRRRSVQETAILSQSRLHGQRSMRSNSSNEKNRDGKSHEALESSQWETQPSVRVFCRLSGLSTLRRTGDVQSMALPNGRTMLKVNMLAGPLQLSLPSGAATPGSSAPVAADQHESNLSQGQTSNEITTVEEVNAEMNLILHPRAGILLHSFQFSKPTKFNSEAAAFAQPSRIPYRGSSIPIIDSINEAAVAQQLRQAIRRTLRSS
ncbi:uncharacterized protein LOC124203100 [Daphnia pulex]|uniref:uncharacterized protein LOC124203100 n=1 Tax=Daphnia pulex TaxID=6669 RepID=UPI001EE030C3|nr:uncharacterized protein LOC124203100 [Daphnia pulex]